jgi:predicted MPP superfamily phosphohydrolase
MVSFLVFVVIRYVLPDSTESGVITSAPVIFPWNSNEDPIIFGHLTDVHINAFKPESSERLDQALAQYLNLSISTLILTGDLVDNWGDLSKGRYGQQYQPDYVEYAKIWHRYRSHFRFVGDIAGNHDEFGLFRMNASDHFFLNYALLFQKYHPTKTENFWVSAFDFTDFFFIAINPFRFPTPHAKFDFWVRQTTPLLDALEAVIHDVQRKTTVPGKRHRPIVIGCHYPIAFWVHPSVRSSSGLTFSELISTCNASVFLSGHTHPSQTQYSHHNGLLEAIGIDLTQHNGISIVTIDNGRLVHHSFPVGSPPPAILTNPVPARQLSNEIPFQESPTEIRVLARSPNITILFTGSAHGTLRMVRLITVNWYLYTCPLPKFEPGHHRLDFSGDWSSSVDFFVGPSLPSFPEKIYHHLVDLRVAQIGFWFVLAVNFVILMPGHLRPRFGPRGRILELPSWLRLTLFGAYLAPLALPLSLIEIDGHLGFNFWYGYTAGGEIFYDQWGQVFVLVYQTAVVLPAALFASSIVASDKWQAVFIVDAVFAVCAWTVAVMYEVEVIGESAGRVFAWTSPLFVCVPIVLYSVMIGWRIFAGPRFFRDRGRRAASKRVD